MENGGGLAQMPTKPPLSFGSLCEDGGSQQEKEMDECGAEVKLFFLQVSTSSFVKMGTKTHFTWVC